MKEENIKPLPVVLHCILHQENLVAKTPNVANVLTRVKQTVNFNPSKGIKHRQFKVFLNGARRHALLCCSKMHILVKLLIVGPCWVSAHAMPSYVFVAGQTSVQNNYILARQIAMQSRNVFNKLTALLIYHRYASRKLTLIYTNCKMGIAQKVW